MKKGIPSLRQQSLYAAVHRAIAKAQDRFGLRVVHLSVQRNHLHLIVEVSGKPSLSKGMQGLNVRVARGLNRVLNRKGTVFEERYHGTVLGGPRQVRNCISYVLLNRSKHAGLSIEPSSGRPIVDSLSSAVGFDGFSSEVVIRPTATGPPPVLSPQTWLLQTGWKRYEGLIDPRQIPGPGK